MASRSRRRGAARPAFARQCRTCSRRRRPAARAAVQALLAGQRQAAFRTLTSRCATFPDHTEPSDMTAPIQRTAPTAALLELAETAQRTAHELAGAIDTALEMVRSTVRGGGTLFFCGNGGSAADAQHMATEYVVRYMRNRRAYPAIALTTDTSLLTAAGNDFGFDHIFSRQVEALAKPGD